MILSCVCTPVLGSAGARKESDLRGGLIAFHIGYRIHHSFGPFELAETSHGVLAIRCAPPRVWSPTENIKQCNISEARDGNPEQTSVVGRPGADELLGSTRRKAEQ
jgi:hypothetical protein